MAQAGSTRPATHAGSWYSDDEEELSLQLDQWLDMVPESAPCVGPLSREDGSIADFPKDRARIIIAPHAGYSYSGRAAAWAYRALDLRRAKRIFLLGPSHHHYTPGCLLSPATAYDTPLGPLAIDTALLQHLATTHGDLFDYMSASVDAAEHSLEMHLPYIHKMLTRTLSDYVDPLPPLVPIMVGNTSGETERAVGAALAEHLADPENAFVVSSDFAHWGTRFRYTYYEPDSVSGGGEGGGYSLRAGDRAPSSPSIAESIGKVDMRCIGAVESGSHAAFLEVLQRTGNTVCGRHPIGIVMAGLEVLRARGVIPAVQVEGGGQNSTGLFRFVRYERSSECRSLKDSSVSYASAFAVF